MTNTIARAELAREAANLDRRSGRGLPSLVFLTDDERFVDPLPAIGALPCGSLVIVRARDGARRRALATSAGCLARRRGLNWLVAADPLLASQLGADGVHFPESRMIEAHHWRALRPHWLITCAAHSLAACARAASVGADAAFLSPVFATQSHIGARALGPIRLRGLVRQSPLPLYALGGIDAHTAKRLRESRLAGLAAIGALAEA